MLTLNLSGQLKNIKLSHMMSIQNNKHIKVIQAISILTQPTLIHLLLLSALHLHQHYIYHCLFHLIFSLLISNNANEEWYSK